MKILILGAGQVGSTVAESLVSEANDITVVDSDSGKLALLQERLDLRTLVGNASHPSVLEQAGIADTDMLLAVTQSDEVNMVACKLAASLYNTPTRIARIRSADFLARPELFNKDNFCVDFSICPEQILTDYISKLIEFPEALQVLRFSQGKASLVAVRAFKGGPLVGQPLSFLHEHMPHVDTRVAAIFRKDSPLIPKGDTVVEDGDEIFFIAATKNIRTVLKEMRRMDKPTRRVMIVGGGNIGRRLAKALEGDYQVKLIEYNKKACENLAGELTNTLVLNGDGTDEKLMQQENVGEVDVFCALTNDDENNIMSALLAKQGGARKVIALINRSAYVDLVQGGKIDIALSPAHVTIGSLLAYVRQGDVAAVHSLRRGAAEALELVVHGDRKSSSVVGRRIDEIELPSGATIGAVVRGDEVMMGHRDLVIESEDHVIVFVINKAMVKKVEKLFHVNIGFF
ncbi:MAG TPA: Trk system potassium transporter TrkA [Gallionella sp.]|nr:Trk system potassium transporter TrkA [Gallionella sp.]OGS68474.1 MAG: Trk system potassium transport protein TrkA [Gallionellales bacterium GWA2_54_124]OGT20113.1 MAG: Trk system potassium transport protein TrkA [Gallionellales bacterium RIFOXYD12_FULL_53_10]OGT44241.1 MAG: Trk system potassium transport protein TrkA [Gallionellales bacterium RIFOXYD2_FULL_52_7]HCI54200.1 Trk system potassium transporter TrkA [Gallionella sp.]